MAFFIDPTIDAVYMDFYERECILHYMQSSLKYNSLAKDFLHSPESPFLYRITK